MKKAFNKIKLGLSALWTTIISFFSKVFSQGFEALYWIPNDYNNYTIQWVYWVPSTEPSTFLTTIVKVIQRLLVGITFVLWIVNLRKIRKIENKVQKKKKIKKTIIIISILIVLIAACIITIQLLNR